MSFEILLKIKDLIFKNVLVQRELTDIPITSLSGRQIEAVLLGEYECK